MAKEGDPENKKTGRMAGLHRRKVAGVAGLEPVTSAVTGQRSNQLSYTPAVRRALYRTHRPGQKHSSDFCALSSVSRSDALKNGFGLQTPRRWGWGTPLKKRPAARIAFRVGTGSQKSIRRSENVGHSAPLLRRESTPHPFSTPTPARPDSGAPEPSISRTRSRITSGRWASSPMLRLYHTQ